EDLTVDLGQDGAFAEVLCPDRDGRPVGRGGGFCRVGGTGGARPLCVITRPARRQHQTDDERDRPNDALAVVPHGYLLPLSMNVRHRRTPESNVVGFGNYTAALEVNSPLSRWWVPLGRTNLSPNENARSVAIAKSATETPPMNT